MIILILNHQLLGSSYKFWFYDLVNRLGGKKMRPNYVCFVDIKIDSDMKRSKRHWKVV